VVLGNDEVEFLLWVLGIRGEFRGPAKPTKSPRFHALSDFERLFQKSCGGCHMLIQVTGQGEGV